MTSQTDRTVRDELLHAAVGLLNEHGPDALQARKVAASAGTSTMAVYTHFGGMRALVAAVADEGRAEFDDALRLPESDDPVLDLMNCGVAYRRFAFERPHLYRLMFGSTSSHGIDAPGVNLLTMTIDEIGVEAAAFGRLVHLVQRCMRAGRITTGSADDERSVVTVSAQVWVAAHGYVMLQLAGFFAGDDANVAVLGAMVGNLLVALGDSPERVTQSAVAGGFLPAP